MLDTIRERKPFFQKSFVHCTPPVRVFLTHNQGKKVLTGVSRVCNSVRVQQTNLKPIGGCGNATPAPEPSQPQSPPRFDEWCMVELFGHQRIVGKVSETTLAGGAFIRVDVPAFDGKPAFTRFFGPSAIYSLSPVSEIVARGLMDQHRLEPVSRFELPMHEHESDAANHEDEEQN